MLQRDFEDGDICRVVQRSNSVVVCVATMAVMSASPFSAERLAAVGVAKKAAIQSEASATAAGLDYNTQPDDIAPSFRSSPNGKTCQPQCNRQLLPVRLEEHHSRPPVPLPESPAHAFRLPLAGGGQCAYAHYTRGWKEKNS
jgi:hypothetical protein